MIMEIVFLNIYYFHKAVIYFSPHEMWLFRLPVWGGLMAKAPGRASPEITASSELIYRKNLKERISLVVDKM